MRNGARDQQADDGPGVIDQNRDHKEKHGRRPAVMIGGAPSASENGGLSIINISCSARQMYMNTIPMIRNAIHIGRE